jgi:hypothetical protein
MASYFKSAGTIRMISQLLPNPLLVNCTQRKLHGKEKIFSAQAA